MHRALASALPDADVDRRAWHLALAAFGPDDAASSALEQAGLRARQRSAYEVSSRAYERGARLAPEQSVQGRLLYAAADAAWLGGLADRAAALAGRGQPVRRRRRIWSWRSSTCAATSPSGAGRSCKPRRSWWLRPSRPRRPTLTAPCVMLAEAVWAAFYAATPRPCVWPRNESRTSLPPRRDGRTAFFALIAQGMAQIIAGEGERGAAQIRQAVEMLERSDELRDDPRLLAWAAMGSPWLRQATSGGSGRPRAGSGAEPVSAVGVLPSVLMQVSIGHAASDRWTEALAGFHEAIDTRP